MRNARSLSARKGSSIYLPWEANLAPSFWHIATKGPEPQGACLILLQAHEARSTRRANFNLKEFARKEILKGPVGYCSFYINGQDKKGAAPWD